MEMNRKSLNFNIKILIFMGFLITAYFYIDKLEALVLVPCILCVCDAVYIFIKVKDRIGLRVIFFRYCPGADFYITYNSGLWYIQPNSYNSHIHYD